METSHIIDEIFAAFRQYGHREYGERVTMQAHMLQTALFAEQDGADSHLIAAAILHDYGHLIHGLDEDIAERGIDGLHEEVGADYLQQYFVPAVTEPIRLHVAAKRYLCSVDAEYLASLSPASVQSLEVQGGPYDEQEARIFEGSEHFVAAVALRRYDDRGKVVDMETPDLEHFRPHLLVGLK